MDENPGIYFAYHWMKMILISEDKAVVGTAIDLCDPWDESMKYSRDRYKMSLSKVVEALLQEWLAKEKRKPLDNSNQGKFFN